MEKAIEDEVDIINLSLGNDVNVPDYPTSIAVNRASELGIIVVIANGNSYQMHGQSDHRQQQTGLYP